MFEAPKKPFLDVLAEDVRINPQQGVFENVGSNLLRASDKVSMREQYRTRARQLNAAMEDWRQNQAALRQQMMAQQRVQPPLWPKHLPPIVE